ncbi:MAG: GTPase Era [Oscillospiraceae bacterium]|nr:GTPase Era [Oscillospiraceae bacterium]
MITIAGRPNVGKSTLTNRLVGEKITIVSPKPQTTRRRILAVTSRGSSQFVFADTPGYHRARTKLGDYMDEVVRRSVADVDAVVLMAEPVASVGSQEKALIDNLRENGMPAVLVINKADTLQDKRELLPVIAAYSEAYDFTDIVPISARTGEGVEELLDVLEKFAAEGPQLFPDDYISDQPEKQICAEIIREKLLLCLDHEIPHGTAVVITRFIQRETDDVIELDATIYCEKQTHKGIIIGKKGSMLKRIGELSRRDIERFMGAKVFMQTWVKVKENWRDSDALLRNFGFTDE